MCGLDSRELRGLPRLIEQVNEVFLVQKLEAYIYVRVKNIEFMFLV